MEPPPFYPLSWIRACRELDQVAYLACQFACIVAYSANLLGVLVFPSDCGRVSKSAVYKASCAQLWQISGSLCAVWGRVRWKVSAQGRTVRGEPVCALCLFALSISGLATGSLPRRLTKQLSLLNTESIDEWLLWVFCVRRFVCSSSLLSFSHIHACFLAIP